MRATALETRPGSGAQGTWSVDPHFAPVLGAGTMAGPEHLLELSSPRGGGIQVSLFLPKVRRGPQTAQNAIRWKNLLARTEVALRDVAPIAEADATLQALRQAAEQKGFWRSEGSGLAVFAAPGWSRVLHTPSTLPELAAIGDRFLISPLLRSLSPGRRFLFLALDRAQARLFVGTRFGLEEAVGVQIPAGPGHASEDPRQPAGRPEGFVADRGGSGKRVVFYGRGNPDQKQVEETLQYFRTVDAAVAQALDGDRSPLLLAGLVHLVSQYRQVTRYREIVEDVLVTDPSRLPIKELHRRAWLQIEPHLRGDESAAATRYRQLAGTGLTAHEPDAVLLAARSGQVESLFVSTSAMATPHDTNSVLLLGTGTGTPDVLDQLDEAAAACLAHGGAVYLVPPERMPAAAGRARTKVAAALLRY
jgi:release factor family 3